MKIEPKGAKREPKRAKMEPKATKREPKGAEGSQKGDKREPRGAKREPKGTKRDPKGAKREPKGTKGEPKDDQNAQANLCPKKGAKKERPTLRNGSILEPFLELRTFKSVILSSISCFFVIFGKVEKNNNFGTKRASHFQFPGLPKPQLFARLLSQGYLQIHLPNEIT